jgi:hypothetical protein
MFCRDLASTLPSTLPLAFCSRLPLNPLLRRPVLAAIVSRGRRLWGRNSWLRSWAKPHDYKALHYDCFNHPCHYLPQITVLIILHPSLP